MPNPPGMRFRATLHYDGCAFHGWQVQPGRRTVQGELERTFESLFGRPVRVQAAGRTDAGVHATAQEVAFGAPLRWSPLELTRAANSLLPEDVRLVRASEAPPDFHPRFDASARRYEYLVGTQAEAASPLWRNRLWAVTRPIDHKRLDATASLAGHHDFCALSKRQPGRGTTCRIECSEWAQLAPGYVRFLIVADRFLHHMVRYIVATSIDIGSGKRTSDELERLLASDPSVRPPVPAPAWGLYLTGVRYGRAWNHHEGLPFLMGYRSEHAT